MRLLAASQLAERLRVQLDIYSGRTSGRLAVVAVIALTLGTLAADVKNGVGPIWVTAAVVLPLLLVWANHQRFLATVEELLERRAWLVIALPLFVYGFQACVPAPTAVDDLLRHIAQAFWPHGYADMYVHTSLPPAPLYPGFDLAVGSMAHAIGLAPTMWLVLALAWISFLAVFLAGAFRVVGDGPQRHLWVLTALIAALSLASGRLFLGRPEVFMTTWVLAGVLPRSRAQVLLWTATGVVLSACYYLAPVYFPAVLLLPGSTRQRLRVFAGLGVAWLAIWLWISGMQLVPTLLWTFEQAAHRLPDVGVGENQSIFVVLRFPAAVALIGTAFWAWRQPDRDSRFLLLAAYFACSLQFRYVSVIGGLFALFDLSALRHSIVTLPRRSAVAALAAGCLLIGGIVGVPPRYASQPHFELPAGAVVLTAFDTATYATLFKNPGRVRVAPAFEVGAASPEVQRLLLGMWKGALDCKSTQQLGFTHLVERTLRGEPATCLQLLATQGEWRLWQVR